MKGSSIAAVLLVLLTACTRAAPEYESTYSPPTTASVPSEQPRASTEPSQASFLDNFDRPDTTLGLGDGWDMRGPYVRAVPQGPAADGFIKDGRYTYSGASVVFALRQFRGIVRSVGAVGRFRQAGKGAETLISMAIVPNGQEITDNLHFLARRTGWEVEVRRANGTSTILAAGRFSPALEIGRDYRFELAAADQTVTVNVPGTTITRNLATAGLLGDRAFWQEYPLRKPAGTVFDFDLVWAAEEGQPLFPVT